ncbi:hypothetical protein [Bradyrhizobium sp. URHD0069]|uniref:hypothetical protein n=1 Tax=Bradyrhizobium sp. URHD0069 TaxID=1380355 RepID=UPI0012DD28C8|nr:hypothetical protein [Bradyrhizobium sp. URHD0069]
MTKSILVSLAVLALSTSVALAAQRTHHSRAVKPKPNASTAAMNPSPYAGPMNPNPYARPMYPNAFGGMGPSSVGWPGGVSNSDREQYIKNLRDSGYDKKQDFNPNGTVRTQ